MASEANEEGYALELKPRTTRAQRARIGLLAGASALAGGLAVAWWHRRTLAKLQNPIQTQAIHDLESELMLEHEGASHDLSGGRVAAIDEVAKGASRSR